MKKTFKLFAATAIGALCAASCSKPYQELNPKFSSLAEDLSTVIKSGEKVDVAFTLSDVRGNKIDITIVNENEDYIVIDTLAEDNASGVISIQAPAVILEDNNFKVTVLFSDKSSGRLAQSIITVKPEISASYVKLEGKSNCYVIKPGAVAEFPTFKGEGGAKADIDAIELGWQDEKGLYAGTLQLKDSSAIVKFAEGKEGNALLLGKKNGVVVWSWHFWVASEGFKEVTIGDYTFLDRNIGAISLSEKTDKSIGVIYQYGRKDPFPCIKYGKYSESVLYGVRDLYDESGNTVKVEIKDCSEANNIETTIKTPTIYYRGYHFSGCKHGYSWLTTDATTFGVDNFKALWENEGKKTAYDPCPAGYKVASVAAWNAVKTQTVTEIWDNEYETFDASAISPMAKYIPGSKKKVQFRGCDYGGLRFTITGEVYTENGKDTFEFAFANCIGTALPKASVWCADIDPEYNGTSASLFRGTSAQLFTEGNGNYEDISSVKVKALDTTRKYQLKYALPVRCIKVK